VSEYQYYEFTAVDRPLTTREQSERVLDPAVVADYRVGDSASAWTSGKHLIIRLNREDEDGTDEWDIGGEGLLSSIIGVRASLAAGDLRLLCLGWLRCVQSLEVSDDAPEPPVPAGLATLDAPLTAVAEYLRIDRDLITAAAADSPSATAAQPTAAQLRTWVTRLPAREKNTILSDLITGDDTHLRAQLPRRYHDAHATGAFTTTTPRTAGELLATAGELRAEREGRDAQQRERDRVRQADTTVSAWVRPAAVGDSGAVPLPGQVR
jgi:hypothetical protein